MRNIQTFSGTGLIAMAIVILTITAGRAQATAVGLDFSDSSQYADFTEYRAPGNINWTANNGGYIFSETSSTNPNLRYDGADDLLTETVSVDYWLDSFPSSPAYFGINTRMQSTKGVMGLIKFTASDEIEMRMYYHADLSNGSLGTVFYRGTYNLNDGSIVYNTGSGGTASTNKVNVSTRSSGSTWSNINPMTLAMEQTAGDDPSFRLTLTDNQGMIGTTGWQILTATDSYNDAGYVGTRLSSSGDTIRHGIDNFTIVPEPASLALLGLSGMLLFRRRHSA